MQAQIEQVRSMLSHRLHKEVKFMKWMNKVDKDHNETLCIKEWGKLLKRIKNHESLPWELTSEVTTLSFQQVLQGDKNCTADNEITYSGLKEWLNHIIHTGNADTNQTLVHPQQQQQQPSPTDMSREEQSPSGPEHLPASPATPLWWKCSSCENLNGDNVGHLTRCQCCDHKYSVADHKVPVTKKRTKKTGKKKKKRNDDNCCDCFDAPPRTL